jgi:ElaB/YqjD/DUF883 family membrane-anchored ribosome-binding protein
MTTPFDVWMDSMNKQAVDALVPGQVGTGVPNPGTIPSGAPGSLDSDPAGASNTDLALQRFAQGSVPVLSATDADGGMGYSHPAPGTSSNIQMFADVKAAAIIQEGQAFADQVYLEMKQANVANIAQKVRGVAQDVSAAAHRMTGGRVGVGQAPVAEPQGAMAALTQGVKDKAQQAAATAQAGVQRVGQQAQEAVGKAQQYVQQGAQNAARRGAEEAANHPYMAAGIGGAAVAGAGAAGYAAGSNKQASEDRINQAALAGQAYAMRLLQGQA